MTETHHKIMKTLIEIKMKTENIQLKSNSYEMGTFKLN